MATFVIGRAEINLDVIGAGLRDGLLPPRLETESISWNDLDLREMSDLEAFEAAGWRFHRQRDLNWRAAEAMNGGVIRAGLLARHSWGGLVVLPNHLVVGWPEGSPPVLAHGDEVEKLPLNGNVFDVLLLLPDANLEGVILERVAAYQRSTEGRGDATAEPMLLYHLVHRGVLFNVGASTTIGTPMDETTQWHWDNIQLSDAWDKGSNPTRRGQGVRVAVIDFGFDLNEAQIKSNIAETALVDGQGIRVNSAITPDDHGTLCAGLVGALLDGVTVNGDAPECALMLVAVESITTQVALQKAIELCATGIDGKPAAKVISCSIGPPNSWVLSTELQKSLDALQSAGGPLIVWADFDVQSQILQGSVEASPDVLCIGQSDSNDQPGECGFGSGLALLAPGVNVTGITGTVTGASCSAPIVAGVAALMLAKKPALTASQIAKIIEDSCDRPRHPNTRTDDEGWGRLNAASAVDKA